MKSFLFEKNNRKNKITFALLLAAVNISMVFAADHVTNKFKFFNPDQTRMFDRTLIPPRYAVKAFPGFPKKVSELGFFSDVLKKKVDQGYYHFEVNNPLWSDGAHKSRYLALPNKTKITFVNDSDAFVFPESTTIVKNFAIDTVEGDTNTRVFIETRLLVHKGETWYGFSYKWRKDQTDADLVGGENNSSIEEDSSFYIRTGNLKKKRLWHWPSWSECYQCHMPNEKDNSSEPPEPIRPRHVLGFITPQLNRLALGSNTKNQIQDLIDKNFMQFKAGVTFNSATSHRWYALDDSTHATLEQRARSFLASNCSHCHNDDNMKNFSGGCLPRFNYFVNSPINYLYATSKYNEINDVYLRTGTPDSIRFQTIFGGKPNYSSIIFRMSAIDSTTGYRDIGYQMPLLATVDIYPLAIRVVSDWIKTIAPSAIVAYHKSFGKNLRVTNNRVYLPKALAYIQFVRLLDIKGKEYRAIAHEPGIFIMPAHLQNGVYTLIAGADRFYLPYFPAQ